MKIDASIPSPLARTKTVQQKPANSSATATGTATGASTRPARQAVAPEPLAAPFDSQRVAEIRQAVADGRFKIDAGKIADHVLDGARERLAKDQPTK